MRKSLFMASAALGAMTAAERSVGRYMRAPDHPAPAPAPAPAAEPAPPAPAPEPEKVTLEAEPTPAKTADQLYDEEFGGSLDDDSQQGDDPPAKPDPAEPAPEPKDVAEPEKKVEPPAKSLEDRLAAAEAAAEEARREARELRERMEPKPKAEEQQEQPSDPRPDPEDYDFGEADSAYITDLANWTATQKFNELMAERDQKSSQDADYAEMQDNWNASISAEGVAEQYPDFQDKVTAGADRGDWHCTQVMTVAIKSSPVAADVAYELATNGAESKRIAALQPIEQVQEIARLEGKYLYLASQKKAADPTPAPTPAPSPVKPSKAPEPPVRNRGAGGQFNTELDATYDKMLSEFK